MKIRESIFLVGVIASAGAAFGLVQNAFVPLVHKLAAVGVALALAGLAVFF